MTVLAELLPLPNFEVGLRLSLQVEVQCCDWAESVGPERVR